MRLQASDELKAYISVKIDGLTAKGIPVWSNKFGQPKVQYPMVHGPGPGSYPDPDLEEGILRVVEEFGEQVLPPLGADSDTVEQHMRRNADMRLVWESL